MTVRMPQPGEEFHADSEFAKDEAALWASTAYWDQSALWRGAPEAAAFIALLKSAFLSGAEAMAGWIGDPDLDPAYTGATSPDEWTTENPWQEWYERAPLNDDSVENYAAAAFAAGVRSVSSGLRELRDHHMQMRGWTDEIDGSPAEQVEIIEDGLSKYVDICDRVLAIQGRDPASKYKAQVRWLDRDRLIAHMKATHLVHGWTNYSYVATSEIEARHAEAHPGANARHYSH